MPNNPVNAINRGVYISDNLPFLQSLNDGCIDLVCIDPPFAKNETFGRQNSKSPDPLKPPLSDSERSTELTLLERWSIRNEQSATNAGIDWPETRYKDFWSWQDVHESWLKNIEDDHPGVHKLIEATQEIHTEGTAAYLCYMAVRLFEIRRVLKDTGSIYLHCDHTAGAYLKMLMDSIFDVTNFQNDITWQRTESHNSAQRYGNVTDTILFYTKTSDWVWNKGFHDQGEAVHGQQQMKRFSHVDDNGRRYRLDDLTAPRPSSDSGKFEWRGTTPGPSRGWGYKLEQLEQWWAEGQIHTKRDGTPRMDGLKRYLDETEGKLLQNIWTDVSRIGNTSSERIGYPTQKPVALAERIIKASCPEGGVVLDCFAGCAYVPIAAERLGRNWIACDINPRAWTVFKRQFAKPTLAMLTCQEPTDDVQSVMLGNTVTVHGPHELPTRSTPVDESVPPAFKLQDKPRRFKTPASVIPETEMMDILLNMSGYQAWCCGFANRRPNGSVIETTRNFHLDHLNPVSKAGTSHQITNRAPLCPYHNIKKSNQRLHLAEYREQIAHAGELMVDSMGDLIDLDEAVHQATLILAGRMPQTAMHIF